MNLDRLEPYLTVPLRWGVAIVFFYFGLSKYLSPQRDIITFVQMGFPQGIAPAASYIFGALELFVTLSMVLGIFVRQTAVLASGLLLSIIAGFTLKFGFIGFDTVSRDVAILGAALALIIKPSDPLCMKK